MQNITRGYIFWIVILSLFALPSLSQNSFKYFNYTTNEGLPSNETYMVYCDSQGLMWIATNNGVSRYDGREFLNFGIKEGLPDNTVFKIRESDDHRIWFVPFSLQLSYFQHNKIRPYKYNQVIKRIIQNSSNAEINLSGKKYDELKLMPQSEGEFKIDEKGNVVKEELNLSLAGCNYLYTEDENAESYISSFDNEKKKASTAIYYKQLNKKPELIFYSDTIRAAKLDRLVKNGRKWLYSNNRTLFLFDPTKILQIKSFSSDILSVYCNENSVFVGTREGLYYAANGSSLSFSSLLNNVAIGNITSDQQGALWCASLENGIFYFPDLRVKNLHPYHEKIIKLTCTGNLIYAGTSDGKVIKMDKAARVLKIIDITVSPGNKVLSMYYDSSENIIWLGGTKSGGYIKNDIFYPLTQLNAANTIDKINQYLFTGHWMYMNRFGYGTEVKRIYNKEKKLRFDAICKYSEDSVLIGSIDGLYIYNISGDSILRFKEIDKRLSESRVVFITADSDKNFYFGTKGKGLFILTQNKKLINISETDGLLSDNIRKIIIQGNVVWISCNKGLNKVTLDGGKVTGIQTYRTKNGLCANDLTDMMLVDDTLWLTGPEGISVLPAKNGTSARDGQLLLTQINIAGKDTNILTSYKLNYSYNNIKIKANLINYPDADLITYRYRLLGLDSSWISDGIGVANFAGLHPGKYKFECEAKIPGASWTKCTPLTFEIAPPFWKTWWFYIIEGVIVFILMFYLISAYLNNKRKKQLKEEELTKTLSELELKALRAQINPHFLFNVLYSIQHYILFNKKEEAQTYLGKFAKLLRSVLQNSEHNFIPLTEELDALKLYMELEAIRFDNKFGFNVEYSPDIDIVNTKIPPMLLQPIVENAIKHGLAGREDTNGKIEIKFYLNRNILFCEIKDNGIGRKRSEENNGRREVSHKSMGSQITKDRLETFNKLYKKEMSLEIIDLYNESNTSTGTKVVLNLPTL